ncbi:MAG: chromosomal replication initiator protein DnaA [Shimia sp.]
MTQHTWGTVREGLKRAMGTSSYKTWIEPLELEDMSDGVATFQVPTTFVGNYVSQHFGDQIIYQMRASGLEVDRLGFAVNTPAPPASQAASAAAPVAQTTTARRKAPALADDQKLEPRYVFENFVVGKPNELAFAAAKRVAEGGPVIFNPLFLYGGVGLGKTHLMHAIAWDMRVNRPELSFMYLSAEQFMMKFIAALRENRTMDFKQDFRSVDVLMIDDVQYLGGKESTQEEFFHTFNALVDQGKQIVMSADRAPGELKDVQERIASRMASGLVVDLHPTDYDLRLGILKSKVELYRKSYPGLDIEEGVLPFLAHRISTNVRVLEGALTRLFAFASLVGRRIDMDLTQDCLSDILRASDRKITVEEIQRKVCDHYNIKITDLVGPKRLRAFARPRQVAMYLSKRMTQRSLPEIGRKFGNRDHTTIMHGVKRIEELMSQDSQIADDLETLRRTLEA